MNRQAREGVVIALCLLCAILRSFALGQPRYVERTPQPGGFIIVESGVVATILVDKGDYAGVIRAANDLQADIGRVTGITPAILQQEAGLGKNVLIVGTLGKSPLLDRLAREHKIDVSQIEGQWESFLVQVVSDPLPGVARGLVIAGSNKRGTIYGIYDLSEQIGVSPWYWWADVPVKHSDSLFVKRGKYVQGPPGVKYRGIFLNDEAPCLTGWVKEKYGDYNHQLYTHVFELLLRLKANYLWPAMWNNCFNEDDPLNPMLADEYGIVMGTSHVEPMMRADKEWNRKGFSPAQWNYDKNPEELRKFWQEGIERNKDYENLFTIAMRGKIDTPMSETANIALLEKIVAAQREIIGNVMHTNPATVPQLWALYKEVQEYYEKGMRVPDDVTLLWCDDNWGNIRRLPTPEELRRSGGAGIYYHFDYVGGPRNYKWINTNPISKVWEQMNLAWQYGADRVWIVNVGDLKPMEFPMEYFLSLAWSPKTWPKERISEFTRLWAEREFGPTHAAEIADIISNYTKYNGRRKPELLEPSTYSLVDYQEADRVVADFNAIVAEAEKISGQLPEEARAAFFELVLHPTKASAILNELYVTVGKNRLYAAQGRARANLLAAKARSLFQADQDLSDEYNHKLLNGKWDHMMDQTHIGYTYWQQPPKNVMPKVLELDLPEPAQMGVAMEGSASAWSGVSNAPPVSPTFDSFNQPRRYIDVFNKGKTPFEFSVTTSVPWLQAGPSHGTVEIEQRVWVSVDWNQAPKGSTNAYIKVQQVGGEEAVVKVELFNPKKPDRKSLKSFVEADGFVSMEAEHYTRRRDRSNASWCKVTDLGRSLSAMTIFPVRVHSVTPPQDSPCLEYKMYIFHPQMAEVEAIVSPSLNFVTGRGLRFGMSFDDDPPQTATVVPKGYFVDNGVRDWEESVRDSVRKVKVTLPLKGEGYHTLKVWMVDPGVVLQKIVVNLGGVKPSYLGPPESYRNGPQPTEPLRGS